MSWFPARKSFAVAGVFGGTLTIHVMVASLLETEVDCAWSDVKAENTMNNQTVSHLIPECTLVESSLRLLEFFMESTLSNE